MPCCVPDWGGAEMKSGQVVMTRCRHAVFLCFPKRAHAHTHLSAFRSPSTLLEGCSFSTLMQPFICPTQRQHAVLEKASGLRSPRPPTDAAKASRLTHKLPVKTVTNLLLPFKGAILLFFFLFFLIKTYFWT